MRRAPKVDENHAMIREFVKAYGAGWLDLQGIGNGCPDSLVTYRWVAALWELKRPHEKGRKRANLNKLQAEFHQSWPGLIFVVRSIEDAQTALGRMASWCPPGCYREVA